MGQGVARASARIERRQVVPGPHHSSSTHLLVPLERLQQWVESQPRADVAPAPAGGGVLETYTVVHGRDGAAERGVAIGRLDDGRRFVAALPKDRMLLEAFEGQEEVGRAGTVRTAAGVSTFDPA